MIRHSSRIGSQPLALASRNLLACRFGSTVSGKKAPVVGVEANLADCRTWCSQHVVWGEQDVFGHLNNVFYVRMAETCRIVHLERIARHAGMITAADKEKAMQDSKKNGVREAEREGESERQEKAGKPNGVPNAAAAFLSSEGIGPILGEITCKYKAPLTYPDKVTIGTRVIDVQDTYWREICKIVSHASGRVVFESTATIVTVDYAAAQRAEIPGEIRQVLTEDLNGTLPFYHRE